MQTLGYRRNAAARSLATAQSRTIGVVTSRTALSGPTSILLGVENAAHRRGYFVTLASVADCEPRVLRQGLEYFLDQSVQGIVAIGQTNQFVDIISSVVTAIPVVTVAAVKDPPANVAVVSVDNVLGARLAVSHLVELGHRNIFHLRGPVDSLEASAREDGWRSALGRGLATGDVEPGDWSIDSGYRAGINLLQGTVPEAIFAGNDEMAVGLLRAFEQKGVSVPNDVSIVGFDDIPAAGYVHPALTTVRQDFNTLGERCVEQLELAMLGHPSSAFRLIQPLLVVRDSTKRRRGSVDSWTDVRKPKTP